MRDATVRLACVQALAELHLIRAIRQNATLFVPVQLTQGLDGSIDYDLLMTMWTLRL
jgi:hypothetical protein